MERKNPISTSVHTCTQVSHHLLLRKSNCLFTGLSAFGLTNPRPPNHYSQRVLRSKPDKLKLFCGFLHPQDKCRLFSIHDLALVTPSVPLLYSHHMVADISSDYPGYSLSCHHALSTPALVPGQVLLMLHLYQCPSPYLILLQHHIGSHHS